MPDRNFRGLRRPAAGCGLNSITFDRAGDLYVSDSFGGNVFKLDLPSGAVTTVRGRTSCSRPGNHGFPPFGANGLAFDKGDKNLYVANTADDRILKVNVADADASRRSPRASTAPTASCSTARAGCGSPPTRATTSWR